LNFDDIEVPIPGDEVSLLRVLSRKKWADQNGLAEVAPTRFDAQSIIDFAQVIQKLPGVLLCHCGGGMSRAPAAALICLTTWQGPGSESECVRHIRKLRPGASPHIGLTFLADSLLERGGALVAALTS